MRPGRGAADFRHPCRGAGVWGAIPVAGATG